MKTVKVTGMSCQHCVQSVTKALSAIDGVVDVAVSLEKGEASFNTTKPVEDAVIKEAIVKIGFMTGPSL